MTRINIIDNIRGIAFILMVIQHIFVFNDISNNFLTTYSTNPLVELCGWVSRILFIVLAGISLTLNKDKSIKTKLYRTFKIGIHALILTLVTYYYYPDMFIRFGILHFLAISTFILSYCVSLKNEILYVLILVILFIKPPKFNNFLDVIFGSAKINTLDWYSLFPWMGFILLGIIIGNNTNFNNIDFLNNIEFLNKENILTLLGKNSLELYTFHMLVLIYLFSLKNKYYI